MKQLESIKKIDELYEKYSDPERLKDIKYVEREEDPELKALFEDKTGQVANLSNTLADKVDGEMNIDLHGNIDVIDRSDQSFYCKGLV